MQELVFTVSITPSFGRSSIVAKY